MKSKNPSRKIFNDTVDLFGGTEEDSANDVIVLLPIDSIHPFKNHPFRLYDGERLEDMVESIKEHDILTPVVVREDTNGYEMLAGHNRQKAGHNRQKAGKMAGLKEIPAVVKSVCQKEKGFQFGEDDRAPR